MLQEPFHIAWKSPSASIWEWPGRAVANIFVLLYSHLTCAELCSGTHSIPFFHANK